MWVRILKTNRGEIHAVVQTPKVLNSFINDLWTLKKVHCIDSYEHTFKLLEAVILPELVIAGAVIIPT